MRRSHRACAFSVARAALAPAFLVLSSAAPAGAQCPDFEPPGVAGEVLALAVFQGELYVGGDFDAAGSVPASRIARWNGSSWAPLGSGVGDGPHAIVTALAVFDDGTGPALWVGGQFRTAGGLAAASIASWDGTSWTPLPPQGGFDGPVLALEAHDPDGAGPAPRALFAGGAFARAGGAVAGGLARWSPQAASWQPALGAGVEGAVHALVSHAGSLYLGGRFASANGVGASNLARFDGLAFHSVAGGTDGLVQALAVADHGAGPVLYVAGSFDNAGGVPANGVALLAGPLFVPLGNGVGNSTPSPRPSRVFGLYGVDRDGDGLDELVVAGRFTSAGPITVIDAEPFGRSTEVILASWNGASWSQLGLLGDDVRAVVEYQGELVAAGRFQTGDQEGASRIARYDQSLGRWMPLSSGAAPGGTVRALAVHDFGQGPELVAGGELRAAGTHVARGLARWNGADWAPVAGGTDDVVRALASYGSGLVAAGAFGRVGGVTAAHVASFDGASWQALGAGLGGEALALAVFQGALVVGGSFQTAGGGPASFVARWDGAGWSPLGHGTDGVVRALAVFDDGSGLALYAGGDFERAGRGSARHAARWDGSRWHPLALGIDGPVHALASFDDGSGSALYAGGAFERAGASEARNVARWSAGAWGALGTGVDAPVHALAVRGVGPAGALWVGGEFEEAGGLAAARIARWNAASWSAAVAGPVPGLDAAVLALSPFVDGRMYAGGGFTTVGGTRASAFLAALGCTP